MSEPLSRLWAATVERAPRAIAVVEAATGRKWTRFALSREAAEWAACLPRRAGKPAFARRRIAMSAANGVEWFQVFLGLLSVGAVPVPIDPSEPEAAQAATALQVGAACLWGGGRFQPVGAAAGRPRPSSECLVKLTSGSSGVPKALAFTHGQMEADGRQICHSMRIGPGDSSLAAIPLGYSYGLGNLVVPLLAQGSPVLCVSSTFPQAVAAEAARLRPTVFPAVPPLLRALVGSDVPSRAFASVRLVISAGSALPPELAGAFAEKFGRRVHGFYGTSETGGIAFDPTGDATLEGRSVGIPMHRVQIAIGRAGRLTVSGPAVFGRGLFSPADRAELNPRGELVLLGRTGRMVKVAGRRLDLAEIEGALRALPGIRDALAHLGGDAVLGAAVATELSSGEIRRLLRPRLASWKVPSRILTFSELPANQRGKTDARLLRQLLAAPRMAASISTLSSERQMSAPR
jgi:long-chain acyl-CoA synthetase